MSISTTIIPFQFDEEAFKAQIESEVKAGVMGLEALTDLRLMVLETIATVDIASDNFSDIFSDSDGYLNTVTSSNYYDATNKYIINKEFSSGDDTNVTFSSGALTGATNQIILKIKKSGLYISNIKLESNGNHTDVDFNFYKNDVLFHTINIPNLYSASQFSINLPFNTFNINDLFKFTASANCIPRTTTAYATNDYFEKSGTYTVSSGIYNIIRFTENPVFNGATIEQDIILTYNKAKPTSLYFVAFSGVSTSNDIGDLTIELLKDATSLGVYNAFEIYNDLTLADTPNKLIIKQADTSVSKIKKFCLLLD